MPKAYFIGGTPRVGKTTLSIQAIQKHPMLGTSTDALRYVLRNVIPKEKAPNLFVLRTSELSNAEIIERTTGDIQQAIQYQNDESSEVWKSVVHFVESNLEDGFDVLIEGIAVLPAYISQLTIPHSAVFLGNQSDKHIKTTLNSAAMNPYDWLAKQDKEVANAFCVFNQNFSKYIEGECQKYNQHYIEMMDDDFEKSLQSALELLLKD